MAGKEMVQPMRLAEGGSGGVVCCLGVGGLVDLEAMLGLEANDDGSGGADGVEVWVFDAKRPWNLANVFGGLQQPEGGAGDSRGVQQGQIMRTYKTGNGGVIVFDDGDIQEELAKEREAWFALEDMPDLEDGGSDASDSDQDDTGSIPVSPGRKRKSLGDEEDGDGDSEKENERPRQRRRSNSVSMKRTLPKPSLTSF